MVCSALTHSCMVAIDTHEHTHFLCFPSFCCLICVHTDNMLPHFLVCLDRKHCERHFNQQSTGSSPLARWFQDSGLSTLAAQTVRPMKGMVRMKAPSRCDYLYLMHLVILTQIHEYKECAVRVISWVSCL